MCVLALWQPAAHLSKYNFYTVNCAYSIARVQGATFTNPIGDFYE